MRSFGVFVNFESNEDLIDMLLLVNAVRNTFPSVRMWLRMAYFPYARQDRVMVKGEALSLQVAVELVKSCNFDMVEVFDPHSDVLAGMFPAGLLKIRTQDELWETPVKNIGYNNMILVSPDAGALKKIYKLAQRTGLPVLEAGKTRDVATGNIVATKVNYHDFGPSPTLVVVDDICDGGRTFIELAKELKKWYNDSKLVLCVTHGIFSKGKELLEEYYDEVLEINDMRKVK